MAGPTDQTMPERVRLERVETHPLTPLVDMAVREAALERIAPTDSPGEARAGVATALLGGLYTVSAVLAAVLLLLSSLTMLAPAEKVEAPFSVAVAEPVARTEAARGRLLQGEAAEVAAVTTVPEAEAAEVAALRSHINIFRLLQDTPSQSAEAAELHADKIAAPVALAERS